MMNYMFTCGDDGVTHAIIPANPSDPAGAECSCGALVFTGILRQVYKGEGQVQLLQYLIDIGSDTDDEEILQKLDDMPEPLELKTLRNDEAAALNEAIERNGRCPKCTHANVIHLYAGGMDECLVCGCER